MKIVVESVEKYKTKIVSFVKREPVTLRRRYYPDIELYTHPYN